jgi:hypothetical protein
LVSVTLVGRRFQVRGRTAAPPLATVKVAATVITGLLPVCLPASMPVACAAFGDAKRVFKGLRQAVEEPLHLAGVLEMELRVGAQERPRFLEVRPVAHGDQRVVQAVAFSDVVVDVVGGHDGRAECSRDSDETLIAVLVFVGEVVLQFDEVVVGAENVAVTGCCFQASLSLSAFDQCSDFALATAGERDEAFGMFRQPLEADARFAPG